MTLQNIPATLKDYGIRWRHMGGHRFLVFGAEEVGCLLHWNKLSNEKNPPGCLCFFLGSRWWFQRFFMYTPTWGDDPI